MLGHFQRDNALLAVGAISALRQQGIHVCDEAVSIGLASARLPGRLEKMPEVNGGDVWIDGAHNADKIAALARETALLCRNVERPVIVLGVLAAKDARTIAGGILSTASAIVTTEPSVTGKRSLGSAKLAKVIQECGFLGDVFVEPVPEHALGRARAVACARGSSILITGSMYLAGQLRRLWYADNDVIWQRTPWPEQS
jgi:dihydrofolate synthase/folylpolyglutamate synthase